MSMSNNEESKSILSTSSSSSEDDTKPKKIYPPLRPSMPTPIWTDESLARHGMNHLTAKRFYDILENNDSSSSSSDDNDHNHNVNVNVNNGCLKQSSFKPNDVIEIDDSSDSDGHRKSSFISSRSDRNNKKRPFEHLNCAATTSSSSNSTHQHHANTNNAITTMKHKKDNRNTKDNAANKTRTVKKKQKSSKNNSSSSSSSSSSDESVLNKSPFKTKIPKSNHPNSSTSLSISNSKEKRCKKSLTFNNDTTTSASASASKSNHNHNNNNKKEIIIDLNTSSSSSSDDDDDIREQKFHFLTCAQFEEIWRNVETQVTGASTELIEHGSLVRNANSQDGKQYGRITFSGMQEIFRLANITEYDTFLDIGHGIGNACLQAAYTQGCKVKGIELVHERNIIANVFKDNFEVILNRMEKDEKKYYRRGNTLTFQEGSLTDEQYFKFLIDVDITVCNNAENCFGDVINDYVSMLFASMKPGSKLITLYPLHGLGRDLDAENEHRKNLGKPTRSNSSYFTLKELTIGKNSRNWCPTKDTKIYYYTRISQHDNWLDDQSAFFFCYNKRCNGIALLDHHHHHHQHYSTTSNNNSYPECNDNNNNTEPQSSIVVEQNGKKVFNDSCIYCGQKRNVNTRKRNRKI